MTYNINYSSKYKKLEYKLLVFEYFPVVVSFLYDNKNIKDT